MIPTGASGQQFIDANTNNPIMNGLLPVPTEIDYSDIVPTRAPRNCRLTTLGDAEVIFRSGRVARPMKFSVSLIIRGIHDIALVDTIF
jgi:hypothetical protein